MKLNYIITFHLVNHDKDCGLRDSDAEHICEGLKTNERLSELVLSRNIFSIIGGIAFGRMLSEFT